MPVCMYVRTYIQTSSQQRDRVWTRVCWLGPLHHVHTYNVQTSYVHVCTYVHRPTNVGWDRPSLGAYPELAYLLTYLLTYVIYIHRLVGTVPRWEPTLNRLRQEIPNLSRGWMYPADHEAIAAQPSPPAAELEVTLIWTLDPNMDPRPSPSPSA